MRSISDYTVVFRKRGPGAATILDRNYVLRVGDEDVAQFKWDREAWVFVARLAVSGHISLDEFTESYLECLLGTATMATEDGDLQEAPRDLEWENISPEDLGEVFMDCRNFQDAHGEMFEDREAAAGHDFCLTRNGHGAGFFDGDWPEPEGSKLTEDSRPYGTQGVMVYLDPETGVQHLDVHN